MNKVAVVTGANKGIGLAIVRGLCKSFKGDVYLTSRDEIRGKNAIAILNGEGLYPQFHELDVTNKESIAELKNMLVSKYGGLDLLVNNAGVLFYDRVLSSSKIDMLMETNYFGVVNVSNILFPILRKGARVVHVSSSAGNFALVQTPKHLQHQITGAYSVEEVTRLMRKFTNDAKDGSWKDEGWPKEVYGMSKSGVTIIARIQQRMFDADSTRPDIIVNACCPGMVYTDMTEELNHLLQHTKVKSPAEGADTPLYLALLPVGAQKPKGSFCRDRRIYQWDNDPFIKRLVKYAQKSSRSFFNDASFSEISIEYMKTLSKI